MSRRGRIFLRRRKKKDRTKGKKKRQKNSLLVIEIWGVDHFQVAPNMRMRTLIYTDGALEITRCNLIMRNGNNPLTSCASRCQRFLALVLFRFSTAKTIIIAGGRRGEFELTEFVGIFLAPFFSWLFLQGHRVLR